MEKLLYQNSSIIWALILIYMHIVIIEKYENCVEESIITMLSMRRTDFCSAPNFLYNLLFKNNMTIKLIID